MKKKLLRTSLVVFAGLCLGACTSKTNIAEKSVCPKLNIENTTTEQIELSKVVAKDLTELRDVQDVYYDVLKKYNRTENVDKYVTLTGLEEIGQTEIFETLIAMKTLGMPGHYGKEKAENIYIKSYQDVLNNIDSKNDNWCNSESYKHIINETKK